MPVLAFTLYRHCYVKTIDSHLILHSLNALGSGKFYLHVHCSLIQTKSVLLQVFTSLNHLMSMIHCSYKKQKEIVPLYIS